MVMSPPQGGHHETEPTGMALKLNVRNLIAIAVVSVWTITALASIITTNYTALGAVTPVMMIVAGFLFGTRSDSSNGSRNGGKK